MKQWFFISDKLGDILWPVPAGARLNTSKYPRLKEFFEDDTAEGEYYRFPIPEHLRQFDFKFRNGGCVTLAKLSWRWDGDIAC